jgi:HAD superfamily hydrolase (TIGR01509 family)
MTTLRAALAERVVVADGAIGTMLLVSDATVDDFAGFEGCNEILNLIRPDILARIHEAYLEADAECLTPRGSARRPAPRSIAQSTSLERVDHAIDREVVADRELAAVLFDMDGLLIDSEPLWLAAETEVMARLGGSPWTAEDQHALLGGSLERTVRYLRARATRPQPPDVVADWLMSGVEDRVRTHGVPLQPGAAALLAAVKEAGLPHALVTSSERSFMDAVLASTGLTFDLTVCADDVTHTKPDPEPYLRAAKLLGVPPDRCSALEDSPNGVASAEAAGCRVFAVPSLLPIAPGPGRTVVGSLLDLRAGPDGIIVKSGG